MFCIIDELVSERAVEAGHFRAYVRERRRDDCERLRGEYSVSGLTVWRCGEEVWRYGWRRCGEEVWRCGWRRCVEEVCGGTDGGGVGRRCGGTGGGSVEMCKGSVLKVWRSV